MKNNRQKGITLVALVVTIVVLLILAGVSLNLVLGNNGIVKRAQEAKKQSIVASEKESVELAYTSAVVDKLEGIVIEADLQRELDKTNGAGKTLVSTNADGSFNVLFKDTEHNYNIGEGGTQRIITFSFYDRHGTFRETLYAYAGQSWRDWQNSGLAGKQGAGVFDFGDDVPIGGHDNLWTPDVGFYYDAEANQPIYIIDMIEDGKIYYTW